MVPEAEIRHEHVRGAGAPWPRTIWLLLLLTGCDASAPTQTAPQNAESASEDPPRPASASNDEARRAAKVAETYFRLIGSGSYDAARRLRWDADRLSPARFAAGFAPYREFRATVGEPSLPLATGGWLYVSVPVHRYGTMRDGKPFGNVGTVMLSRRDNAASSPSGGRGWRILPGD